ncbi:hypothetical protein [Bradyrhizobium sp. 2S1]|uniref:hypothetical protein n=1 Tax=Bradyrhizobium sp. 2S1 TaxID=1404429 RepID=UPI001408F5D3|nr:hypothetical protein [Bradyrhizobium sp. 2S1]MCK7671506.1 hypothetical protein [Bradyrhizobium sp. 2S1]
MTKPEQLKMFDLPDVEERVIDVPAEKPPAAPKRAGQRNRQPALAVRQYEVKSGGDYSRVQAASRRLRSTSHSGLRGAWASTSTRAASWRSSPAACRSGKRGDRSERQR